MDGTLNNEELAMRIKNGDTSLIPLLWGSCRKVIYKIALRHRYLIAQRADVEMEDLEQCGYFAMLKAVEAYDSANGYKFISYIERKYKDEIFKMLGAKKTRNGYRFPILASSLNEQLGDNDENEFVEMLEDENAGRIEEDYEKKEMQQIVREAVDRLPELERYVIQERYFKGRDKKDIIIDGQNSRYAECVEAKAMRRLRKDETIQALRVAYFGYVPHKQDIYKSSPEKAVIEGESWEKWFNNIMDDIRRFEGGF